MSEPDWSWILSDEQLEARIEVLNAHSRDEVGDAYLVKKGLEITESHQLANRRIATLREENERICRGLAQESERHQMAERAYRTERRQLAEGYLAHTPLTGRGWMCKWCHGDNKRGHTEACPVGRICDDQPQAQCEWDEDEDGNWTSCCRNSFTFETGGPSDNGFCFCPYCGRKLVGRKWQDDERILKEEG